MRAAWINDRLAQILTKLSLSSIHPDGAGTLAERDAVLPAPPVGFIWLRVETGAELEIYKRTASGWDGPFSLKGDEGDPGPPGDPGPQGADGDITWEGAWASGVNFTANQAVTHGGSSYVAKSSHLSAGANEPGVGGGWAAVWDVLAAKGTKGDQGDPGADGTGTGDVVGPAGATANRIAVFDGTTGKLLKDGGKTVDELVPANGSVTNSKLAEMATARMKGRATAGNGSPEDLTLTQVLDMLGSVAQGDLLFRGASDWVRLPKGTAGQYLKQNTALTAPEWVSVPHREVLTASRTYYVRGDGVDTNDGKSNTAGGAFLTIAKAISAVLALDLSIYNVIIQLGAGTWNEPVSVNAPWVGSGSVTLLGDATTPANVTIATATAVSVGNSGSGLTVSGLTLNGTTNCLVATGGGTVKVATGIVFAGNSAAGHMRTNGPGSSIEINANYTITSGAARHLQASPGGYINCFNKTITLSGTLVFSTAFAQADRGSLISTNASTFTGGAITGKRYDVATNAVIFTGGAGASHFPGDVAGTMAIGGQYA